MLQTRAKSTRHCPPNAKNIVGHRHLKKTYQAKLLARHYQTKFFSIQLVKKRRYVRLETTKILSTPSGSLILNFFRQLVLIIYVSSIYSVVLRCDNSVVLNNLFMWYPEKFLRHRCKQLNKFNHYMINKILPVQTEYTGLTAFATLRPWASCLCTAGET